MRPALLLALALSACATAAQEPAGPPRFTPAAGAAATPQMRLYVDCIAQAIANRSYDREEGLIRFSCGGAAAETLYTAFGPWSAKQDSEVTVDGRTIRSSNQVQQNLTGVDYCWHAADGAYGCTLVYNAGDFILPR